MQNRVKTKSKMGLFVENFIVYGLGNVFAKLVPLLMLPIVTSLLPNTYYYGLTDLTTTITSFGQAFASMGMYDAMYRMFFEREEVLYKKKVCSTALLFTLFTSLVVFILMLVFSDVLALFVLQSGTQAELIFISASSVLIGATNSIISAPARMENKRKIFLVVNFISPILSYSIVIPLIMNGYYVIALPLAGLLTAIATELFFAIFNRKWFSFKLFDKELLKNMLVLALPAVPSFLMYWIFNSCDRIMISSILGVDQNGIYAVGAKIGQCSQLIYTAFSAGWQYVAFSTMRDSDQIKSNSMIFEYMMAITSIASVFIFALSNAIFEFVFTEQYRGGYMVAGYLFMAPLLQMLYQIEGTQRWIKRKTWPNLVCLTCGAVLNVTMNAILIPKVGIEGAAIATLLGYSLTICINTILLYQEKMMIISGRLGVVTIVTIAYIISWRLFFHNITILGVLFAMILTVVIAMLYREDLKTVVDSIKVNKG